MNAAERSRLRTEAKIKAALEQPDFAKKAFQEWKQKEKDYADREERRRAKYEHYTEYWAKLAWLAEGRMLAMGRELTKAQQRIGRQRKVNRAQHQALKEANERIRALEGG